MKRLALILPVALSACTVDTELGVAADIQAVTVTVTGSADTTVVAMALDVEFRVGEHAQGAREFVVPRAEIFVADMPVAVVNLGRPTGFDGTLSPGERQVVHITGSTLAGAFPGARDALCLGSPSAVALISWSHHAVGEPATMADIDTASAPVSSITCDPP